MYDEDTLMDRELNGEGLPIPLEQLLQQAGVLAQQLQRERAHLEVSSRAGGRPGRKALEQQLVHIWSAIRAARSPGIIDTEVVRRRPKWS